MLEGDDEGVFLRVNLKKKFMIEILLKKTSFSFNIDFSSKPKVWSFVIFVFNYFNIGRGRQGSFLRVNL